MKTCTLCGLQYQTMAERGYKYCHPCAILVIRNTLAYMLPILFEFPCTDLERLADTCKQVTRDIEIELARRAQYFAHMMEQRKPR